MTQATTTARAATPPGESSAAKPSPAPEASARIIHPASGGRVVELYLPFEVAKRRIESIVIGPIKMDHTLRWRAGKFSSTLALLAELSNLSETVLRELRYPDAQRVIDAFMEMLPPEIRTFIEQGSVPVQNFTTPDEFDGEDGEDTTDPGRPMPVPGRPPQTPQPPPRPQPVPSPPPYPPTGPQPSAPYPLAAADDPTGLGFDPNA